MEALLNAVVDIGSDLEMSKVLQRLVVAASELSGARYAAMGVLATTGEERLAAFITHGVSDRERAAIGALPEGHGILGLLVTDPRPIRLDDLSAHESSYGFPPGHPPMRTFLGVPVQVRGTVYGNLYLTEKQGGVPFTEQDEHVVKSLAAAASFVIENARLFAESESRRELLEATAQINEALVGSAGLDTTLPLVARFVGGLVDATAVVIVLAGEDGSPVVHAADGDTASALAASEAEILEALATGQIMVTDGESATVPSDPLRPLPARRTRTVLAPLRLRSGQPGVLVVTGWRPAWGLSEAKSIELLTSFADQATLAIDRARARSDEGALAVLADRDRIARDLHDLVIQRLFATGLQLQGAVRLAVRPEVTERITATVAELDATIRDIRATIFELHHRPSEASLRADLRELAMGYSGTLGFSPTVQFSGPVDSALPEEAELQLLTVVREGLSNVARHAHAAHAHVEVSVEAGAVLARITDDGVGAGQAGVESGLHNLRERAQTLDGAVRILAKDPHGTVLEWRVPLRPTPSPRPGSDPATGAPPRPVRRRGTGSRG